MDDYVNNLIDQAVKEYPFIAKHNPIVMVGNAGEDYAETWPKNEPGAPNAPRPKEFPSDRVGVMIGKPNEFTHHDLAGELMHVDPIANKVRKDLIDSMTAKQLATLATVSGDFKQTMDEGRPAADAVQNGTDSAMRGYLLNQWPKEANDEMKYNKDQLKMLDSLKSYMKKASGKKSGGVAMPQQYSTGNWKLI